MKKLKGMLLVGFMASLMMVSGCKLTPEQIKVIAQNAGLFSAVGWIAYDNPSVDAIESVKSILVVIRDKAGDVEAGKTYTEVIYPELIKVINEKVVEKDRPLCKAASLTLLNGIDTLFAMHPEWKKSQDIAVGVVEAYIFGAENGLSMSEDHPVRMRARNIANKRARIYRP